MALDFSQFMTRAAGQSKKPPTLEPGDYPGVVKSYELGVSKAKNTPFVRFHIALTGWAPNVEPIEGVDLSKRQMRTDFYLTDASLWRLDEFLRSMGIDLGSDSAPRTYEETVPEAHGRDVVAEVKHYVNNQSGELGNEIGKVSGVGA